VPIQPGTTLGPYEVQDFIGQGAMGLVYKSYHAQLERTGAVKVLQAIAPDLDSTARFRREAQAIAQMRHPNILNVYDFGEYEGTPYMIVEFVPGGSLAQRMRKAPVDQGTALKYLRGIATALDHAHALGIVHRDVKPANVLLGSDDTPILADFGLAKLLQSSSVKSMSGVTTGTPAYMAPEQVTGSQVGPPADRYSLATVAYELLTGVIPFDGEGVLELLYAHVHRDPPAPSSRKPDLGPRVDAVVLRGLAKDPATRWESCQAFVDALAVALAKAAPTAVEKTLVMERRPSVGMPPPAPAAAVAGLAVAAAVSEPDVAMAPPAVTRAPTPAATRRSHKRRNAIVAAAALLLLVVGGVVGYEVTHAQPTLSLPSTTVQAGDKVVVTVNRLPANQGGELQLLSPVRTFPFRADANGNVSVEVSVPRDIGAGDHLIRLCFDGACHAETTLHVTALVAPGTPSPTSSSTPSATPSPSHSPGSQSIVLSSNTVQVGGTETVAGKDFDPAKLATLAIVQSAVSHSLVSKPVDVRSDGSFVVTVTIPSGIHIGAAEIVTCTYNGTGVQPGPCAAKPVTVTG